MGKKRQQSSSQKQPSFKSTPFSALKGVSVPSSSPQTQQEPPRPTTLLTATADTDNDLFLQAMGGVTRLEGVTPTTARLGTRPHAPERSAGAHPGRAEVDPADTEAFSRAIGQMRLDVTFSDKFPEDDELKPLGANRLRQLKRGIIRVDRQLDLHGLTRDEALEAMPRFLRNARVHGEKAVLIITGKGINSPGEPVLQQAVAAWLRDAGREFILEFAPAPREMGGGGAFVVFLRER